MFDEPEVEPARWVPELTTLSLDIETDPKVQRLLSVALWGCGAREVLLLCPDAASRAACPAAAVPCDSEAELLTVLCERVRALDPDVVTGWNIIDFDVPVLIRRAWNCGCRWSWAVRPARYGSAASHEHAAATAAVRAGSATRSSFRAG